MAKNRHTQNNGFIMSTLEELVPQDHLVRKLEEFIDWDFIYDICDPLYSHIGTERVDPVILFKLMFINIIFGIHSMRRTCQEAEVNVAYRWFLGLNFGEKIPDHSTFSQNYTRKFKKDNTAIKIFEHFIRTLIDNNIVDPSVVFVDGTHLKANANKNKSINKEVEVAAKRYQKELDEEIDKDRAEHFKKELKRKKKELPDTKEIKTSISDPDCGYFHKGEKEKCFAYNINVGCDIHGYVLGMSVDSGNVHDSDAFFHLKDNLDYMCGEDIETYVGDTAYVSAPICHMVNRDKKQMVGPYKRSNSSKKGMYKKREYQYIKEDDVYVCPLGCVLKYSTTNKEGRRQYKSDKKQCSKCPHLKQCTEAKNGIKVIERHIWDDEKEECIQFQRSPEGKEIYSKRKQTIERVFGDGKRKHGLDYTLYTGFERVYDHTILIFTGMNMKKLCTYYGRLKDKYAQNMSFDHQNESVLRAVGLI